MRWLPTLVLGLPGRQRFRTVQTLLALAIYTVLAAIHYGEMRLGFMERNTAIALNLFFMTASLGFYVVIRSGLNLRLSMHPALTLAQTAVGVLVTVSTYAVTGPARGAVMSLLVLILAFGMFALTSRQSRGLILMAALLLGSTMFWMSRTAPTQYPLSIEIIHFGYAALVLSGVSVLSIRMGELRDRLRAQKSELEQAMTQIMAFATRDELTGLTNRRHMAQLMGAEQARQFSGSTMIVVLIDVDHFKRINDSYGHSAGDAVLRQFAQISQQVLRAADVLARWGGEEFLVMLPATTPAQALRCIHRMRAALAITSFDSIAPGLKITFSAGISACGLGDKLEAAIEEADQAMYRAKNLGRNQTVIGDLVNLSFSEVDCTY